MTAQNEMHAEGYESYEKKDLKNPFTRIPLRNRK